MKIAILGDSISEGIGKKKINYENLLSQYITRNGGSISIRNFSLTGTTIKYPLTLINEIYAFNPEVIITMYGNVDAQIRPNMKLNKYGLINLTPKRYKNIGGMLNPRPFNSSKWYRKILNFLDNIYRKFWKKVLIVTQGEVQLLTLDEFTDNYQLLVKKLRRFNLYMVSTVFLDENIYKGSNNEYKKFNQSIARIASDMQKKYIDIYNDLSILVEMHGWNAYYYDDHFHLNLQGYQIIAKKISENILLNEKVN